MRRFALAGNPNSGKTTLFNSLTGATAHVGNWPGVTVDKREGSYRKLGEPIYIIDLPGIYSLSPYTPEEVISRNYILDEKPDCVINIVDATNLERNLYLTTQLLEIDVPVVVALNMSDVVRKNGDMIDAKTLQERLGVPVIEISALKQENLDKLMEEAVKASNNARKGTTIIQDKDLLHLINDVQIAFELKGIENPLFHAIKLVEMDELEVNMHQDAVETVNKFKATFKNETFGSDFEALIADNRYEYIAKNYAVTFKKANSNSGNDEKLSKSDKIDKVMTHRIWALPLFAIIMFFIFHVTFSEDILFLNRIFHVEVHNDVAINALTGMGYGDMVAENVDAGIEYLSYEDEYIETIANPEASEEEKAEATEGLEMVAAIKTQALEDGIDLADEDAVEEWKGDLTDRYEKGEKFEFVEEPALEGVPSIGVWLQSWFGYGTGTLVDLAGTGFENAGARDTWYAGLICDGVLTGLDSVLSFVPQIMILFLFIAILEDSGYMARVAFILDRAFRKFGLSGKAFIPMLTGFGCSVPAIMATRTLEDEKEKNRTIRLMTCFSCGAKAPIWALLAAVGTMAGFAGDIFVFTIYLGGIACAVIFALFMKLFSKDQYVSPFIMELPAYHLPQARNVFAHLWEKLKHYVIKAGTIIAACTIVIWFLSNFGWAFWNGLVPIEESILADLGRGLRFFFFPLGCLEGGWTHGEDGWKYAVSTITGLIAKEDVVATMAELGLEEGTIALSIAGVYSFAIYNLFTLPCFAAIGAAHGEQKGKEFWLTLLWWFAMSYGAALLVYWVGSLYVAAWWGGLLVTLALAGVVTAAGIVVSRRHKLALAQ
ncbi:MAG: ferrous iron transporter B [Bacilli bacterium]|nr:ferrous iron transporter B [Bacilli bacterium]